MQAVSCRRTLPGRLLSLLLLISLLSALAGPARALDSLSADLLPVSSSLTDEAIAERLYALGLFRGKGGGGINNFALSDTATRGEGLTMLIRLLGKESLALAGGNPHSFTDAGWADAYVGYAYNHGISQGVSDSLFGTNNTISLNEFLTLVLRALGYTEVNWQSPYELARSAGLDFRYDNCKRSNMARICYSALFCTLAGSDVTLLDSLSSAGSLPSATPAQPGTPSKPETPATGKSRTPGPVMEELRDIWADSADSLLLQLHNAVESRCSHVIIHVPVGTEAAFEDILHQDSPISFIDCFPEITYYSTFYYISSGAIDLKITYDDANAVMAYWEGKNANPSSNVQKLAERAMEVHASLAQPGMSDYALVLAFHDFLTGFNTYQETGSRSHSAIGALMDGRAVCEGYADAFDLLCYLSGIPCYLVTGTGYQGSRAEAHAWNKVQVDGLWYNVDITWDDPINASRPTHDYFLLSDAQMQSDHSWLQLPFWPAASRSYAAR